ncbi:chymotrypsin-like elastase family member 1 [Crassostrea virginica]
MAATAGTCFSGYSSLVIGVLFFSLDGGSGKAVQLPRRLIIGGTDAEPSAWPWQAGILASGELVCGGTLIEPDMVLTAAHCMLGRSKESYQVVLGDYDRTQTDGGEQFIDIAAVEIHPDFRGNFLSGYDVALLRLVRNVSESAGVGTIELADPGHAPSKLGRGRCIITGWGVKDLGARNEELARKLQEADIEILSNKKCNSRRYWDGLVKPSNLCAMNRGTAACQGDSGSPLVCCWGGSYRLVGITSWGSSTCRNYPSVYTDVSKVRTWIATTTEALRNELCTGSPKL